jgi:hypothetical protein
VRSRNGRSFVFAIPIVVALVAFAEAGPCTCADKADIENRINEAEAAIEEYQKQRKLWEARDKFFKKKFMFTWERYGKKDSQGNYQKSTAPDGSLEDAMNEHVQNAINRVSNPKARKGTAETNSLLCYIRKIDAPTACLAESLRIHEAQHVSYCDTFGWSLTTDYREHLGMAEVARDEITAYMAEVDYLKRELQSASADCAKPRRAYTSRIPKPGFDDGVHRRIWHYF